MDQMTFVEFCSPIPSSMPIACLHAVDTNAIRWSLSFSDSLKTIRTNSVNLEDQTTYSEYVTT